LALELDGVGRVRGVNRHAADWIEGGGHSEVLIGWAAAARLRRGAESMIRTFWGRPLRVN
jgi:hypothetical protein